MSSNQTETTGETGPNASDGANQQSAASKPLASMLEASAKPIGNEMKEATFFSRVVKNAGLGQGKAGAEMERELKRKRNDEELAALLGEDSNSVDAYSAMMLNVNAVRMPSAKSCDPALNETVSNTHVFDTAQSKGSEALFSLPSDWALKIGLRCEMEVVGTDKVPFEWVKTVQRSKPLSDFNGVLAQGRQSLAMSEDAKARKIVDNCTSFKHPREALPEEVLELVVKNENFGSLIRQSNHVRFSTEKILCSEDSRGKDQAKRDVVMASTTPSDKAFYWWRASSQQSSAAAFCYKRRHDWGQSFRSAFLKLRKGTLPYLYYVSSSFVCLFLAEGQLGASRKELGDSFIMPSCAVISKSKRAFRKKLKAFGVDFTMPLNTEMALNPTEQKKNSELLHELKAFRDDSDKAAVGAKVSSKMHRGNSIMDDSLQSLVSVVGNLAVNKLYNFLLNTVVKRGALQTDVPSLISPVSFLGASSCITELKPPAAGRKGNRSYKIFRVEGAILPSSLASLAYTLHAMDEEKRMEITTRAMDETKNFNVALGVAYRQACAKDNAATQGQLFNASHISKLELDPAQASVYLANTEKVL